MSLIRAAVVALLACATALAQQPRIDSLSPSEGPISGGTIVSLRGSGLAGALIRFDGTLATPLSQSDSEVRLQMPPHDNGYAFVSAIGGGGTAYGRYLYLPPRLQDLPPGYITTVAGIGAYNGQYGPAVLASLTGPWGMAFDPNGILYFCDTPRNRVMRIRADGILEPVAGNGLTVTEHPSGPVPALSVSMSFPRKVAFDSHGNLIVPDSNYLLWRVDPNGTAEQIAGTGVESLTAPEGVVARGTPIGNISYVAVDRDDNIYFIDFSIARIRRIDRNGILTTYAGNGTFGFSGDGGPATSAQFSLEFSDQGDLALDSAGNLYLIDYGNTRIRRITKATGIIDTVIGPTHNDLRAIAFDANDALYVADATNMMRRDRDGTITSITNGHAGFSEDGARYPDAANGIIKGLIVDRDGNLIYSDDDVRRVRKIDRGTHTLTTLAGIGPRSFGEGGPALGAALLIPNLDLDFFPDGDLLIADSDRMYTLGSDGLLKRFAGSGISAPFFGVDRLRAAIRPNSASISSDGTVDYAGGIILRIDPDGIVRRTAAKFAPCAFSGDNGDALDAVTCESWDVLRDKDGNALFADTNNNRVRRVDRRTGIITTIAGSGPPNGLERYGSGSTCGDGGPAVNACINTPYGLAFDDAGNLFVCENELDIRKIDTHGTITTFANERCTKLTWAFGNLYTVASDHVSRISPAGEITILTGHDLGFGGDGGPASEARIFAQKQGHGVAVDREGNLFFADGDNLRVRAIRYGAVLAPPHATIRATANGSTIRATVSDASGHATQSVRVDFAAPAGGRTCRFPNGASTIGVITDANGVATTTCTPVCAGNGSFVVTAQPLTSAATATVAMNDVSGPCRHRAIAH